ncbi:Ig-like domain-containing protein [Nocardioides bruguierae]|uniref:Ig-like domain-containing protein n=1 Tax=Nocardioides bruguierae TaxID=2945102 RepID=A0A9X2IFG4_9ACTN|nr:Ig-like domain-containing protein [Nocardioides bruguierae]MCM0621816.1 Ig-like domain-containing protein [Nocardioides bruguierae]
MHVFSLRHSLVLGLLAVGLLVGGLLAAPAQAADPTTDATQTIDVGDVPDPGLVGRTWVPNPTASSGLPVSVGLLSSPSGPCVSSDGVYEFVATGECSFIFQQAGNASWDSTYTVVSFDVELAPTRTTVQIVKGEIRVSVADTVAGAGVEPTGQVAVTVAVDGSSGGSAIPLTLDGAAAHLETTLPPGSDYTVTASYVGDAAHLASTGSDHRSDPGLRLRVRSTRKPTASGWYRSVVKVVPVCSPTTAAIIGGCPAAVRLDEDTRGTKVTQRIVAKDGGKAVATTKVIRIDTTAPSVRFKGRRCRAADATSGLRRCVVKKVRRGGSTVLVATAVDEAGNKAVARKRLG